jgi:hypothetical protein
MCAPLAAVIPVISGIASVGLGIYGAVAGYQSAKGQAEYNYAIQQQQSQFEFSERQRQMDYAFQEQLRQSEYNYQNQMASRQFEYNSAMLQYDAQMAEQQRRFEYEQAVNQQNYDFQTAQTNLNRGYEQMREDQQKSIMELNSELAGTAYANDLRQIDLMFMQEEEAAAQQKMKGAREAAQMRAEVRASGRVGNTVDNLLADYYRQQAQYDFATNRNLAFTGMASQEKKRGAQSQYAARKTSEVPYIKQPYADPVKGLTLQPGPGVAPMMSPKPVRQQVTKGVAVPSPVYKSYVSSTPYLIQGITAGVGGALDTATAVSKYRAGRTSYTDYSNVFKQPGRSN